MLTGSGVAITLTLGRTPDTGAEWRELLNKLYDRMRDDPELELIRQHWIVEWTRKHRPHLHMAVYVDGDWLASLRATYLIVNHWLDLTEDAYGSRWGSQHGTAMKDALGWLQYVSKHGARGVNHYQRWAVPPEWEDTGRLWGHRGSWPTMLPTRFEVPPVAYWRMRRMVRSWRVADARASYAALCARPVPADAKDAKKHAQRLRGARRRITSARGMLRCPEQKLSSVRGVTEWIPEHLTLQLVGHLHAEGLDIECLDQE